MLGLKRVHHIAIIATDYARSKAFYCDILGLRCKVSFIAPSAIPGKAIWRSTASM
ncbi:putative lyase [Klebsiella pneumoniae]|uniref:Putative lyase n=2 Tax=Klebsiella pneumoniae TaxID=573 RepID=A0A377ZJG7_KLEPN|nr:putative lyase [Klebsiella pneumoniae]STV05257.1 putative lyase [Klebsiella pneumoniae subsp. pneumoniae]